MSCLFCTWVLWGSLPSGGLPPLLPRPSVFSAFCLGWRCSSLCLCLLVAAVLPWAAAMASGVAWLPRRALVGGLPPPFVGRRFVGSPPPPLITQVCFYFVAVVHHCNMHFDSMCVCLPSLPGLPWNCCLVLCAPLGWST